MELFANIYIVIYRIAHDVNELKVVIKKQRNELCQALDLCKKCLQLVETIIQNNE